MSAFVNPRLLLDPQDAARKIVSALPDLKYDDVREKLEGDQTFVWIKRGMSPGFAGIGNLLYYLDKTLMLFGDARAFVGSIVLQ